MASEKGLLKKLKTGFIASALAFSFFNYATAQENYKPKYNTVAHKSLVISGDTSYLSLKTLDAIIDSSKKVIPKEDPEILKFLVYSPEKDAKELLTKLKFLTEGMVENSFAQLDNPRRALVFLAIAEENNLPLYGVLIPNQNMHLKNEVLVPIDIKSPGDLYVRWDPDGKHDVLNQENPVNKGDFNWNPRMVMSLSDAEEIYRNDLLNKKVLEKDIYLKNLDKKELLGLAYYRKATKVFSKELTKNMRLKRLEKKKSRGIAYSKKEIKFLKKSPRKIKYKKTLKACNKAIRLFPKLPSSYELKGDCFRHMEKYEKAKENYNKAIEINPKAIRYVKRGDVFIRLNKNEKAERDYEKSKKLCSNIESQKNSFFFFKKIKK